MTHRRTDLALSRRQFLAACAGAGVAALGASTYANAAEAGKFRFGVCGNPKLAKIAATCGFDYFEWDVPSLLAPREDDNAFAKALERPHEAGIPCECLNLFIPADMKITGPKADLPALERHVKITAARAQKAKIAIITFGSSGARNVPDGFDRAKAFDQLVAFGKMAARIAADHGILICVEQLNKKESNILNSVREISELTRAIDHPSFRMTQDGYHWGMEKDSADDLIAAGSLIRHVHIATWPSRFFPGGEECDLAPFFSTLLKTGYSGRVSIEGKIPNPEIDLPKALERLRTLTSLRQTQR